MLFSLSLSLSTRAVYHSRVNETTKLTRSFQRFTLSFTRSTGFVAFQIESRDLFPICRGRLFVEPTFPSLLSSVLTCVYIHIDSRYHWFEVVGMSVDITETRREEFEIGPPTCHKPGPVTIHHGYLGIIDLYIDASNSFWKRNHGDIAASKCRKNCKKMWI